MGKQRAIKRLTKDLGDEQLQEVLKFIREKFIITTDLCLNCDESKHDIRK